MPDEWSPRVEVRGDPSQAYRGYDLKSLAGLVRRQFKLIVAVTIALSALAALAIFQLTPIYNSTALVIVDPRQNNIVDPQAQASLLPGDLARVETEVEILRSPAVLLAVIRDLKLATDHQAAAGETLRNRVLALAGMNPEQPSAADILKRTLRDLQNRIEVSRRGLTYLIEVTAQSPSPDQAAQIANGLADAYIVSQISAKTSLVSDIQKVLQGRLDQAAAAVQQSEDKLDRFIEGQISRLADSGSHTDIMELRRRIEQVREEGDRLQGVVAKSNAQLQSADWQSLVDELDSENLRNLNERRRQLENAAAATSGSDQIDLRVQLSRIDEQMTTEAQGLLQETRARLDGTTASERQLREELRQRVIGSDLPNEVLVGLYQIQQEADASRNVYQTLLARSKSVESQRDVQLPDSRIVSRALPPEGPSSPRTKLLLAASGLAALVLGFGLAFMRENYVGGFITEEQTEAVLGVPVLASVSQLGDSDGGAKGDAPAVEILAHPLSSYSEAIRRARLSLSSTHAVSDAEGNSPVRVVLITSALPGEGKTQTAVSLARSYAIAGQRALLIDGDLRRPAVHKALGRKSGTGLADYLAGAGDQATFDKILIKDPETDLRIIMGSSSRHADTLSLFESGRMERLLASAERTFDVIVIDSSPLLPVADARLLARFATAVVLVVQWARTSQQDTRAALTDLMRSRVTSAPIFAILNRVERTSLSYGYGKYYAPYHEDVAS